MQVAYKRRTDMKKLSQKVQSEYNKLMEEKVKKTKRKESSMKGMDTSMLSTP